MLEKELTTKAFDQMGGVVVSHQDKKIRDKKGIRADDDIKEWTGTSLVQPVGTGSLFTDKNLRVGDPLAEAFSSVPASVPHFGSGPM